jgi:Cu2+-exporting ATPase
MIRDYRRRFWISVVITVPILLLAPMVQKLLGYQLVFPGVGAVLTALASIVYFYGGYPFLTGMFGELRKRRPGMMTLIAVAITAAWAYSLLVAFGLEGKTFFWELATLIDIMLLGHWIEMRSVLGASRALEALARLMPGEAHRIGPDGSVTDVPVSELSVGDRILVRPGEKVPADGVIVEGESELDESMLTGESRPVAKGPGGEVIGGAVNGTGSLTVEVRRTGKDSYLAQVMELVRQAQESRSRTQDIAQRAAFWLTLVALGAGGVTFFTWMLLRHPLAFALERTITVMVITCPHALGLAIPLVVAVSTAISSRNGFLIRDRGAFEQARKLQAVVFDKTGTLTEGRFGVTDVVPLDGKVSEEEILRLAAAVEQHSEHPIARAVVGEAEARGLQLPQATGFLALPGRGVLAQVEDEEVKVVSPGSLKDLGLEPPEERVGELSGQGKTVIFLVVRGRLLGAVALADVIRPESRQAIAQLKKMGLRSYMLTGDTEDVARWVAGELGLDGYQAQVLPHEKSEKIKEIQAQGLTVGMVGDGVNDAPALTQADVGIAIGAGTDVAIASADVVLVRNDPRDVAAVISLARATYRKMIQNLAWATGYNLVAIPLAAGVMYHLGLLLTPAMGAVLMSLSTVVVAINARLLRAPARAEALSETGSQGAAPAEALSATGH